MAYRDSSNWNDTAEMCCLLIMKVLAPNFKRGKKMSMCRELESYIDIKADSLNAKVGNFKSVAGYNNPSNNSLSTRRIYDNFKDYSVDELKNSILQRTECEKVKKWIQRYP